MMIFLWGVITTMLVGLLAAVVFDEEAREAALTLVWVLLIGAPVMLILGTIWLSHKLPERFQWRGIRGRTLSTRALRRAVTHADYHGWTVSRPSTTIIMLKRKAG